jgi:hypothetical protein
MRSTEELSFDPCLPYQKPNEFQEAWCRLLKNPKLIEQVSRIFPNLDLKGLTRESRGLGSAEDFQRRVISRVVAELEEQTTDGLSVSGLENLSSDLKYVILSNHRDIICDPAWVAYIFFLNQLATPKICLGDNLLSHPVMVDLVKMNKGITVKRGLPPRDLLAWSGLLSSVIHGQVVEKMDSVWIAQREGRAKDGDDRTQSGVLKMLSLAGDGTLLENLEKLHILPLAISYEFDPCDSLKAYELFLTAREGHYSKVPGEDAQSMMNGILGFKGRVHLSFCADLSSILSDEMTRLSQNKKEILQYFCSQIDRQIHSQYRLWPSHWIAYDLLERAERFAENYSSVQKAFFTERLENQLDLLRTWSPRPELRSDGGMSSEDRAEVRRRILEAYAMPVKNYLAVSGLNSSERFSFSDQENIHTAF